ncbi:MAG TPA: hypothetical protein VIL32_11400 [Steroidobacteraceae bacterium]
MACDIGCPLRSGRCLDRARGFKPGGECGERFAPELIEPPAQLSEAMGIDVVDATRPFGTVRDESRLLQYFQMLRDRRPAHRHQLRDLTDGARSRAQLLEHLPAGGICKGCKGLFVRHD